MVAWLLPWRQSKHVHLISNGGPEILIGWLHPRPGRPHFEALSGTNVLRLFMEKVGHESKLITREGMLHHREHCYHDVLTRAEMKEWVKIPCWLA